jgi:hypothetical protein
MRSLTALIVLAAVMAGASPAGAAVRVHPDGVNVNMNGATTVFLTFGGLTNQRVLEGQWCGELVSAAPAIGQKCHPATVFGQLPVRFDLSTRSGVGGFTDIMSIPESVARRARQAAQDGARSSFFYVRRFASNTGGPDEYVAVTCRMAGGGARVPFALTDVRLRFPDNQEVMMVRPGEALPTPVAEITFNGTGRLVGRWEVVLPGDAPPEEQDLVPEASLPLERRGTQRRFAEIDRFNIFLPPVGRTTLPGPDGARLPAGLPGGYLLLLRIEASDDKEGDSNLATAGSGLRIAHNGGVAGFSLPPLRYYVGSASTAEWEQATAGAVVLLSPLARALVDPAGPVDFSWAKVAGAHFYRLEIRTARGVPVIAALTLPDSHSYRAPSFLKARSGDGYLQWRITALDVEARRLADSGWRDFRLQPTKE